MATWATHRKALYASIVIGLALVFIGIPIFISTYHPPTCSDGFMNGVEEGIDCGGSCPRICQSAFLAPRVPWTKLDKVASGLYNVGAYIVNPNTNGAAVNVPYMFSLFDKSGGLIVSVNGITTLPPHRNTMAFVGAVDTGKRIPVTATFEFTAVPHWQKSHDTLDGLAITDKQYTEDETSSALSVTLENRALLPYRNIYVFAVLYDSNTNVIGFSRTYLDQLAPSAVDTAPFTWPIGRQGKVASIEVLPVTPPVIDAQ